MPGRGAHKRHDDPTRHETPGLRARPGRSGPAMRDARLLRARRVPSSEIAREPERLLVVLPGPRTRLQRRVGLLQRHDAGRDRDAASRRYRVAATELAAWPAWRRRMGRRAALSRSATRARRRRDEARPKTPARPGPLGTARTTRHLGSVVADDARTGEIPVEGAGQAP